MKNIFRVRYIIATNLGKCFSTPPPPVRRHTHISHPHTFQASLLSVSHTPETPSSVPPEYSSSAGFLSRR